MATLRCGSPALPYSLHGLLDADRHAPGRFVLKIACAYFSQAGLDTIASQLIPGRNAFEEYRSEWVIGIDHGLSEPRALTAILRWQMATLRLFCPAGRLNLAALRGTPRLHAKVIALIDRNTDFVTWIAPSSANITGSAMGPRAQNYEVGVSYESPVDRESRAFNQWWREVRRRAIPATDEIISRYANLRERYLVSVPDRLDDLDPPARLGITNARHLWIEAGKMSGPPQHRHQIEFAEELAEFFHAPRRNLWITLRYGRAEESRPLTFRGTAQGQFVEIWRLGLLTPRMGGPIYANRVVRFTRSGGNRYVLEVVDRTSAAATRWLREANRMGYVGRTGGASGRKYGFY
jgi:hypothetical protein